MMMQRSGEETPLIERKEQVRIFISGAKTTEYAVCLLVAFPTAVLNGLAAISGDAGVAGGLQTPGDLKTLLDEAGTGRIVYGIIALTASEAVLFFLNKRYLLASGKAAVDLVRRTTLTLRHVCCHYDLKEQDRAGFGENGLFFWSLLTSLIFAEMGGKALSFLGLPGEIVGFSLSLAVYFATRFASAKMFLDNVTNPNWRLKRRYIAKLELLQAESVLLSVVIEREQSASYAVMRFLNQVDQQWDVLPKDFKKIIWLQYVAPILGYTLIAITALPIMAGFMPESVQGTELLTHSDIGASSNYQDAGSLTFGAFATTLTLFFYELNIKDLPKHFLRTALSIYEKLASGNIAEAMKLFGLTLLALGSSYLTGIGFKFVADSALSSGYLSYLGDCLSSAIPDGLLVGVTTMLWSHLQELINQVKEDRQTIDMAELDHIDITNAEALMRRSDIDISPLCGNRYALFHPGKNIGGVEVSVNDSPNTQDDRLVVAIAP